MRTSLTSQAEVADGGSTWYRLGDFNGDGFQDLAVVVRVESGRAELRTRNVKCINIDPFSKRNGSELDPLKDMGQNCLGLAIFHGSSRSWNGTTLGAPILMYDCFSACQVIRRGTQVRRSRASIGPTPVLRGDGLQLDLESGSRTVVYWDGRTYRGFCQRNGD